MQGLKKNYRWVYSELWLANVTDSGVSLLPSTTPWNNRMTKEEGWLDLQCQELCNCDWLALLLCGKVALRAETATGHFRTDLSVFEGMPSDIKNSQKSHLLRFSLVFTSSSAFLETKPQKQGPGVRGWGKPWSKLKTSLLNFFPEKADRLVWWL